jgi:exopolyphosphatase / guanosine-5'-triphosphate,3'-diphosphate pyrophosphatase
MSRYAAIDIGSNSVRLLVAEVRTDGSMERLAEDREVTRLGASVFGAGAVSTEALDFVSGVLTRMATTYRRFDVDGIRVVATAAVRDASNQQEFLTRASMAAGAPVEIISGEEEARLIYLGVNSRWPHPKQRILVVDIGGGSAEIIVVENGRMKESWSRPLGAVRLTGVFLKNDPPTELELRQMREFIDEKLAPAMARLKRLKYDRAIATSSTAAAMICAVNRIPRARRDEGDRLRATLPQVRKLYRSLCTQDLKSRVKVPGIGPRRAEIIVPGVSVLLECMERFGLSAFHYSAAGVRDGIVADLAARRVGGARAQMSGEQREVVEQVANKYTVPVKHYRKVAAFCRLLFQALEPLHRLRPDWGRLLEGAAILYDIGLFVGDTGHHKHSQYLIAHSGLPGLTDRERLLIAQLCRFHRKSMPGPRHSDFLALPADDRRGLLFLIPLLRLADACDLSKHQAVDEIICQIAANAVNIQLQGDKVDLELWAAQRVADAFQAIYGKPLAVTRAKK